MRRFWVLAASARKRAINSPSRIGRLMIILFCLLGMIVPLVLSQPAAPVIAQIGPNATPTPAEDEELQAPGRVDIEPTARDEEIRERLVSILEATGWFQNPSVDVREGVVFLSGRTDSTDYQEWAGNLARNTQDVVAVVNQIELTEPSIWDFTPALVELRELWRSLIRSLPLIGFSLLFLFMTWVITRFVIRGARSSLRSRLPNPLLSNVAAYTIGVLLFLVGLYVVFQVSGLTNVALTVLGGTGLLGLVLGIAFRDITENFLASIFLSIQNPFRTGDLVEIDGILGFVQALTTRATIVMTQDGNHVQIPNATVYKSNIYNFTSNPNLRVDFIVGIGFDDPITQAQNVALRVLEEHPAVLKDPEPWVLVDSLGSATVNLRVYFWLNGKAHSWLKVKSSVIRLVKRAFQAEGISMPDEAREMIFPEGVSVRLSEPDGGGQPGATDVERTAAREAQESASVSTEAEAGLNSEAGQIQEQAIRSRKPEEGENLLQPSDEEE